LLLAKSEEYPSEIADFTQVLTVNNTLLHSILEMKMFTSV